MYAIRSYYDVAVVIAGLCFLGLIIGNITNLITERFEKRKLGHMGIKFTDHIIILGWNSFAEDVAAQLLCADKKIAIMSDNKDDIDLIYQKFDKKNVFVCFSDRITSYNVCYTKLLRCSCARDREPGARRAKADWQDRTSTPCPPLRTPTHG